MGFSLHIDNFKNDISLIIPFWCRISEISESRIFEIDFELVLIYQCC